MAPLITPTVCTGADVAPLSEELVAQWRTTGHILIDGLLPPDLIGAVEAYAADRFPAPGSRGAHEMRQFGSEVVFPAGNEALDQITLHPRLLAAAGQLLGRPVPELRLAQSTIWPKYGRVAEGITEDIYDNNEQRIHVDYPNHMLTHPTPWDRPEAIEVIVYYSDQRVCGGATAVVPRVGNEDLYPWPIVAAPGIGDVPWINDRATTEAYFAERDPETAAFRRRLYEHEVHTDFRPGTVLLYRHDVWHRGTPLKPGPTLRLAHNLVYRVAEAEWISTLHEGWSWAMYRPDQYLERLVGGAGLDQRAVLGFPAPGARYWCPATIEAVTARYGPYGFDPAPYRAALG